MKNQKMHKRLWNWSPFTYICVGFDGQSDEFGGVFPKDVRGKCPYVVKKINGPIVKGFGSWMMKQIVGEDIVG